MKCDAAVAEKETAEEKFEYQAEVWFGSSFFLKKVSIFEPLFGESLSLWQVSRLLDLIVHSLYSHKEVFLRELVRYVMCLLYITVNYKLHSDIVRI